ncbi:unnamed protein product, partial [Mycena citricolor]
FFRYILLHLDVCFYRVHIFIYYSQLPKRGSRRRAIVLHLAFSRAGSQGDVFIASVLDCIIGLETSVDHEILPEL